MILIKKKKRSGITMTAVSDVDVEYLKGSLKNAENELTRKDKLISELVARLREYEMGEYGLSKAVGEIKECRQVIRMREREIEILTEQLNISKLQLLDFREKQKISEAKTPQFEDILISERMPLIKRSKKVVRPQPAKKTVTYDKGCQCYRSVYPLNCLKDITAIQVQNEKLRAELSTVCQDVMKFVISLKRHYRETHAEKESIIRELENKLEDFKGRVLVYDAPLASERRGLQEAVRETSENVNEIADSSTLISYHTEPGDCYKVVLERVEKEDFGVQEIFHELANQIKILKQNQEVLIRKYIAMSDREAKLFKDNQELKKRFISDNSGPPTISGKQQWEDEVCELHRLYTSEDIDVCPEAGCVINRNNVMKLIDLAMRLMSEKTKLSKLLEISRHQSKALESICFEKEMELRALGEQLILFQIQSDERMLLGKLAIKILQLQFSNAAFAHELNKYKLDKDKQKEWYSLLLKGHEDNEFKLCASYTEAYSKVKYLAEIIEDVGHRCNEAIDNINVRQ